MGGKGSEGSNGNSMNMFMGLAAMQAADKQYQLGLEQLKWAKETQAKYEPYMLRSASQAVDDQERSSKWAGEDREFYDKTYRPMELEYAQKANNWDTPERQEQMAGQAQSGVASQFEQARMAATQQLEGFGIDPSSTRYGALDLATRTQQAAAAAGAGTKARQDVEQQGLALQGQAINTGRGFQQNINQTLGTGASVGASGTGSLNNFFNTSSNAMTAPVAWFNAGNQAQGNAITAFNNYTGNSIKQQQANTQSASAAMQGVQGMLGSIMSLEDGGAIPTQKPPLVDGRSAIPGAGQPQNGGHVPVEASPSRGAVTDDVAARVNVGEFVVPKQAVEWYGLEKMYALVDKAEQARADTEATTQTKPDIHQGIPSGPPTFVSASR